MPIESRITGGDISLLVKPSLVDRVGFCVIESVKNSYLHPLNFIVTLNAEDQIYTSDVITNVSAGANRKLTVLSLALKKEGFYLAHCNLKSDPTSHLDGGLGSADLYKERKEPIFEGVTESDGIRH